ncbi:MAG TPA: SH3 domain-containing protein [Parvularculaceae bacterium]|nr:SH3 domain-containing protein [Parvularculaceae bacterium]
MSEEISKQEISMRKMIGALIGVLSLFAAGAAMADPGPGHVRTSLNMRAGPGTAFPVVMVLSRDVQVAIIGCLDDRTWCDIEYDGARGWVSGAYISVLIDGGYRPVRGSGARVVVSVLGWDIDDYWDNHYRRANFYSDRERYRHEGPGSQGRSSQPKSQSSQQTQQQRAQPQQGQQQQQGQPQQGQHQQGQHQQGQSQPQGQSPQGRQQDQQQKGQPQKGQPQQDNKQPH